ncbi:nucleosome assembly protein 1-like 1-B, partial [Diaphorina citri]|uniref:Nucleosome assembly protein 1-like 1-B n=1 Tax=Diaphorina citri TaxID=121845 RepID=A0A3Q0JFX8_DIACI
ISIVLFNCPIYKYTPYNKELINFSCILTGTYEPNDEECDWPSDEEEDELSKELKEKAKVQEAGDQKKPDEKKSEDEDKPGIPGFWLTVFHNVSMLSDMVQVYDEPILKHLLDVRVIILEKDPMLHELIVSPFVPSQGQIRIVNKTEPNDSFFNFFNPPTVPEDPNAEIDEETQALLSSDFEIGHYIRERVIPRAVLYFTG